MAAAQAAFPAWADTPPNKRVQVLFRMKALLDECLEDLTYMVSQEHGYGRMLMNGVIAEMRERGIHRMHSQADWRNHTLLQFLDSTGFRCAPRVVLERPTSQSLAERGDDV